MTTYGGLSTLVEHYRREYPEQRCGQAWFNVVSVHRPDLADKVRGTELDPFHRDSRLPAFQNWLIVELAKEVRSVAEVERLKQELEQSDDLVERVRDAAVEYADARVATVEAERDELRAELAHVKQLLDQHDANARKGAEEIARLRKDNERLQQEVDLGQEAYLIKDKDLRETRDDLRIAKDTVESLQGQLASAKARIDKACMRIAVVKSLRGDEHESLAKIQQTLRGEES